MKKKMLIRSADPYCCRLLFIGDDDEPGDSEALHYHEINKTLIVLEGEVEIEHHLRRLLTSTGDTLTYRRWETVTILAKEPHRLIFSGDAIVMEIWAGRDFTGRCVL